MWSTKVDPRASIEFGLCKCIAVLETTRTYFQKGSVRMLYKGDNASIEVSLFFERLGYSLLVGSEPGHTRLGLHMERVVWVLIFLLLGGISSPCHLSECLPARSSSTPHLNRSATHRSILN